MIFQATSKFDIFCVRLILGKIRVDRFIGPRRETYIKYEFNLKVILKGWRCKWRLFQPFLIEFPSNRQSLHCFCQIDIIESYGWQIYRATTGKWCQKRKWFVTDIKVRTVEIDIFSFLFAAIFSDFPNNKQIWNYLRHIDIGLSRGWRIYRATT